MGYLVIDAEGYYGDYATVYAAAKALNDLPRKYARSRNTRVVSDGGFPRAPGAKIHRQDAGQYRECLIYVLHRGDEYVDISGSSLTRNIRNAWTFASRAGAERQLHDGPWGHGIDPGLLDIDAISAMLAI